jgi:hypothetical protein
VEAVTVRELSSRLLEAVVEDPGDMFDREVYVVFRGYERLSFNLKASDARVGANLDDFLIIVEEPRS